MATEKSMGRTGCGGSAEPLAAMGRYFDDRPGLLGVMIVVLTLVAYQLDLYQNNRPFHQGSAPSSQP